MEAPAPFRLSNLPATSSLALIETRGGAMTFVLHTDCVVGGFSFLFAENYIAILLMCSNRQCIQEMRLVLDNLLCCILPSLSSFFSFRFI